MVSYAYSFIYVILTALSMVFIHDAAEFLSPAITLFLGTLLAIIVFHLINITQLKNVYKKAWEVKWLWFRVMLTTAIVWLATIYGPAYASPSVYILLYFALVCLIGIAYDYKKEQDVYLLISGVGVLICTIFIVYNYLNTLFVTRYTIIGIVLGLIGGGFSFIYSKQSYVFSKQQHLSATQIIAVRFWLVELFCLILFPHSPLQYFTPHNLLLVIGISVISLILPIFFYMRGIIAIGPEKNAIICGFVPATTYVIQCIAFGQFHPTILELNLVTGLFIGLPYSIKLIKKKM